MIIGDALGNVIFQAKIFVIQRKRSRKVFGASLLGIESRNATAAFHVGHPARFLQQVAAATAPPELTKPESQHVIVMLNRRRCELL